MIRLVEDILRLSQLDEGGSSSRRRRWTCTTWPRRWPAA